MLILSASSGVTAAPSRFTSSTRSALAALSTTETSSSRNRVGNRASRRPGRLFGRVRFSLGDREGANMLVSVRERPGVAVAKRLANLQQRRDLRAPETARGDMGAGELRKFRLRRGYSRQRRGAFVKQDLHSDIIMSVLLSGRAIHFRRRVAEDLRGPFFRRP